MSLETFRNTEGTGASLDGNKPTGSIVCSSSREGEVERLGAEGTRKIVFRGLDGGVSNETKGTNPRGVEDYCLEEVIAPLDVCYRDVDGQWDCPRTFETQGRQSLPPGCYRRPIPRIGADGFAPISTDVGQGDDRPWIVIGDECGARREDLWRKTIHGTQ